MGTDRSRRGGYAVWRLTTTFGLIEAPLDAAMVLITGSRPPMKKIEARQLAEPLYREQTLAPEVVHAFQAVGTADRVAPAKASSHAARSAWKM